MNPQPENHTTTEKINVNIVETPRPNFKRRILISAIIFGVALAMLIGWHFHYKREKDNKDKQSNQNTTREKTEAPKNVDEKAMLKLAKKLEAAGFKIYGVTQCGWTKHQREAFGGRNTKSRKALENIYTECHTQDLCPDVQGYPTWIHEPSGTQFPGFRDEEGLNGMLDEAVTLPTKRKEEPEEERFELIEETDGESEPETEEQFEARMKLEKEKFASLKAKWKNERKQILEKQREMEQPLIELEEVEEKDNETEQCCSDHSDGEGEQEDVFAELAETPDPEPAPKKPEPVKAKKRTLRRQAAELRLEKMRGVSEYPSLNVPVMPGTKDMDIAATGLSYEEDQIRQGNIPRVSMDDTIASPSIINQLQASFAAIAESQKRSNESSLFAEAKLPQSVTISTGNPMEDKSVLPK